MSRARLITYLKQPYPQQLKSWEMIGVASFFVFFLLSVFQPFGISTIHQHKLIILVGYMLVTALCLSIKIYLFPLIWKKYYVEEKWTLGKEILSLVNTALLIAFGNILYSSQFMIGYFTLLSILFFLVVTFLVALFPIAFFLFWHQNRFLSNNLKKVTEMNNQIINSEKETSIDKMITIEGSTKDDITININQLVYIESNGNYVNIHYYCNGRVKKKMLRTTIKLLEETLSSYSFMIRCHRAFIVNTNAIRQVKGDSQGYRLIFEGTNQEVPVSRSFMKQIKRQIDALKDKKE